MDPLKLIFGTRGSQLALKQTELVISKLKVFFPHVECEIRIIRTQGDRLLNTPLARLAGKGAFVSEIEEALARGEIDVAVHSLKDLPTELHPQLLIAAVPERADFRDVLYAPRHGTFDALPEGACVGTSSLRRAAQLKRLRPDLIVRDIRGNVDTRLRKVDEGQYDATILAAAGLQRLNMRKHITDIFSPRQIFPAPGQGALAVQIAREREPLHQLFSLLDDAETRQAVIAERSVLKHLGGGCAVPLGTYATCVNGWLTLRSVVIHPQGSAALFEEEEGPMEQAESIGACVARRLLERGAEKLIQQVVDHE